jgi:hypothetical protein
MSWVMDIVGVRTNFRRETVYLYHIKTSPEAARRLLLIYLARISELADRPEFYYLLSNSCTINIIRYENAAGRVGNNDIRHLLNGFIDGYLYDSGRIDASVPYEELRRRSLINEAAQAADDAPDFSERIRASLPPEFTDGNAFVTLGPSIEAEKRQSRSRRRRSLRLDDRFACCAVAAGAYPPGPGFGVPNFWNVVSNLPFIGVGAVGLRQFHRDPAVFVIFLGIFLTGVGSSYYHWDPSDRTLFWDRLP